MVCKKSRFFFWHFDQLGAGALGLPTDGMCGEKIGFYNRTLTVQQKIGEIHTLTVHFPQIFRLKIDLLQ